MSMQCVCRVVQRQTPPIGGGVTRSIFPRIEVWLQESTDHWKALEQISGRKDMTKYRSVVDFIFAETNQKHRKQTFLFYWERSPRLEHLLTEKERLYFEARMLLFLEMAYAAFCKGRALSWKGAVAMVDYLSAA